MGRIKTPSRAPGPGSPPRTRSRRRSAPARGVARAPQGPGRRGLPTWSRAGNRGEDSHRAAAARALKYVDREDALHQLCPRESPPQRPGGAGPGWCAGAGSDGCTTREPLGLGHRLDPRDRGMLRRRGGRCAHGSGIDLCRCRGGFKARGGPRGTYTLPRWHDAIALTRARPEDAVVGDEMEARRRDERGEILDELLRREDDVVPSRQRCFSR